MIKMFKAPIIYLDKSFDQPVNMARGQKFEFRIKSEVCPFNDDAVLLLSYGKTEKSIIKEYSLLEGLEKVGDELKCIIESKQIREIYDFVYGEFLGFGKEKGYRHLTFVMSFNNSANS